MTFEKTLFLSVVFHAVILSALTITLKKPLIIPIPFEVNLVSPDEGPKNKNTSNAKIAGIEQETVKQRVRSKPAPLIEKKSLMPAKTVEREKKVRPSKADLDLYNKRLAEIEGQEVINQGIQGASSRVTKLKQKLVINKKQASPKAAPSGGGTKGTGTNTPCGAYEAKLQNLFKSNYYFPDQRTHGIEAVITIDISKDGIIFPKGFEQRSGNSQFDNYAMRTVLMTGKGPVPPHSCIGNESELEIKLSFTPD